MKEKLITAVLLFFSAVGLSAHGVKVTVEKKSPFIAVHAGYHGGKDLAAAKVTIDFEKEKATFQEGDTDKNGNFCFYPDKTGTWAVTVDDRMGHRGKKSITLTEDFFVKKETAAPQEKPVPATSPPPRGEWCCYLLKIVLAILLILLITYILHRWLKGQETSQKGK